MNKYEFNGVHVQLGCDNCFDKLLLKHQAVRLKLFEGLSVFGFGL